MAWQVKNSMLSLLWLWIQLGHMFDPWPGNFCLPQEQPKKKKKNGGDVKYMAGNKEKKNK